MITRIIQNEIAKDSAIPFSQFMSLALYHPEYGYYSSPREKIGLEADFDTSPSIHPVFATLIAKQIVQMAQSLDCEVLSLIEFGAGDGTLCRGILDFIREQAPSLFCKIAYLIIEISPSFRTNQRNRLLPAYAQVVQWKDAMPSRCIGIVLSNEFVDALPAHRLRVENGTLKEVYVTWQNHLAGGAPFFSEVLKPPSDPALSAYFNRLDLPVNGSFDLEINLLATTWMQDVSRGLQKGFVITIDYGYPERQLYSPQHKRGTFLCYYKHTINESPYQRIGEQDMTTHVDFTALARAGKEYGLSVIGFTDQTCFLMGLRIDQEMQRYADQMEASDEARRHFLSMKQLIAPDKMGKPFKVLIQGKGVPKALALEGLSFKAFPKNILGNTHN
ncbi:MAG: SAM-dependent methyltransferase [Nitrospirota bacterium]